MNITVARDNIASYFDGVKIIRNIDRFLNALTYIVTGAAFGLVFGMQHTNEQIITVAGTLWIPLIILWCFFVKRIITQ
jgi:hypothetical protein